MEANKINELRKELTYAEFPSKFIWKNQRNFLEEQEEDRLYASKDHERMHIT
jgi:hypothetical protein